MVETKKKISGGKCFEPGRPEKHNEKIANISQTLLTLNFSNCTRQNILLSLIILERRDDFVDDGLGKVGLFTLLHLLLIAHPAVKDRFEFCTNSDLLLLNVVL